MYKYMNRYIIINNNIYEFEFNIRTVIKHKSFYIALLAIPFNIMQINNIYCLDEDANLIWQSEDLHIRYPYLKNLLPYEQMGIKNDTIFASDFYGRSYKINIVDGKIEEMNIVR